MPPAVRQFHGVGHVGFFKCSPGKPDAAAGTIGAARAANLVQDSVRASQLKDLQIFTGPLLILRAESLCCSGPGIVNAWLGVERSSLKVQVASQVESNFREGMHAATKIRPVNQSARR